MSKVVAVDGMDKTEFLSFLGLTMQNHTHSLSTLETSSAVNHSHAKCVQVHTQRLCQEKSVCKGHESACQLHSSARFGNIVPDNIVPAT